MRQITSHLDDLATVWATVAFETPFSNRVNQSHGPHRPGDTCMTLLPGRYSPMSQASTGDSEWPSEPFRRPPPADRLAAVRQKAHSRPRLGTGHGGPRRRRSSHVVPCLAGGLQRSRTEQMNDTLSGKMFTAGAPSRSGA